MRIKYLTEDGHIALLECEHCRVTRVLDGDIREEEFHNKTLPAMTCYSCGKTRAGISERDALATRVAELEAALPESDKLELIALWFDKQDAMNGNTNSEVQVALRRWAAKAREALKT